MKRSIAILALACAQVSTAWADTSTDQTVPDVPALLFPLQFWSSVPDALLKRCEREYPDKLLQIRTGFMHWVAGRPDDLAGRVEAMHSLFAPRIAAARKQSMADYKRQIDETVSKPFVDGMFGDFTPAETEEICTRLDLALPRMLPDEFTRDELVPALEKLEDFRRRLAG